MLTIDHLTKYWNNGTIALEDITFTAHPSSIIALIGSSGSGKSTLLKIIAKLTSYNKGKILYPEASNIGMVFQSPSLWPHLTLIENVSIPLKVISGKSESDSTQIAENILVEWGLKDRLNAYPAELSGGQQQRGALARALVMNPAILCLDEVTSALDPELTASIFRKISALKQLNTITLIATHHLGFVKKHTDYVIFLEKGKIVESGQSLNVLSNPESIRLQEFMCAAEL